LLLSEVIVDSGAHQSKPVTFDTPVMVVVVREIGRRDIRSWRSSSGEAEVAGPRPAVQRQLVWDPTGRRFSPRHSTERQGRRFHRNKMFAHSYRPRPATVPNHGLENFQGRNVIGLAPVALAVAFDAEHPFPVCQL